MRINTSLFSTVSLEALRQDVLPALDKRIVLIAVAILSALFVAYRVGYYYYQNRNAPIDGDGKKVNLLGLWSEGTFKNGQLHGEGKYELLGGGKVEGTFENGWPVKGKIEDGLCQIYEGEFEQDCLALKKGTLQWAPHKKYLFFGEKVEQPIYEGTYHEDSLVEGTATYPDGKIEEGTFDKSHRLLGQGTRTLADGTVEKGVFYKGKLI